MCVQIPVRRRYNFAQRAKVGLSFFRALAHPDFRESFEKLLIFLGLPHVFCKPKSVSYGKVEQRHLKHITSLVEHVRDWLLLKEFAHKDQLFSCERVHTAQSLCKFMVHSIDKFQHSPTGHTRLIPHYCLTPSHGRKPQSHPKTCR